MRTMDLDLVRPQIGEFTLDGKVFKVMEPTIGQRIMYRLELKKSDENLAKLKAKGVPEKYEEALNAWLAREIQIFIPEFTKSDLEKITYVQRTKILQMIFEVEEETPEKVADTLDKKKGNRKRSHGEKS